jgi:HAD superfamily hydrolase (TIGR01509 family)
MKGVIFDFDGVIFDSNPIKFESLRIVLEELGVKLTMERFQREFAGRRITETVQKLLKENQIEADYQKIVEKRDTIGKEMFEKYGYHKVPGVEKIIKELFENNYPLAIASGSRQALIEDALEKMNLTKYFKVVVSAFNEEVKNGKPAPDVFLLAARKIGIEPEECLVFEDGILGMAGAKEGGMKCIALSQDILPEDLVNLQINSFNKINLDKILKLWK